MIYRYGYYDPTEKQRCNDCGGSGTTGFDVFDDDLDEWVVEKCVWSKSKGIDGKGFDLVKTQCGDRVSKSSIFSPGSQYKFCPFCGKEIDHEWIRR